MAPSGGQAGGQTRKRQVRALTTADSGGLLPTPGLGVYHLGWAAIFSGRPSWRLLVGLGRRLGANLSSLLISGLGVWTYLDVPRAACRSLKWINTMSQIICLIKT